MKTIAPDLAHASLPELLDELLSRVPIWTLRQALVTFDNHRGALPGLRLEQVLAIHEQLGEIESSPVRQDPVVLTTHPCGAWRRKETDGSLFFNPTPPSEKGAHHGSPQEPD